MNARLTIDNAGRLVLPKAVREALRIGPGDTLELESDENHVVLRPARVPPGISKERGVWVYRSGKPADVSIPDLIGEERRRRIRDLLPDSE